AASHTLQACAVADEGEVAAGVAVIALEAFEFGLARTLFLLHLLDLTVEAFDCCLNRGDDGRIQELPFSPGDEARAAPRRRRRHRHLLVLDLRRRCGGGCRRDTCADDGDRTWSGPG